MPRPPTRRPPAEHLAALSRMMGQVDADDEMSARRRKSVKELLSKLMSEFQKELTK